MYNYKNYEVLSQSFWNIRGSIIAYNVFVTRFKYWGYFNNFRLSGNVPFWFLSYASIMIIMLLLKSSKPSALFRFKLLNTLLNLWSSHLTKCIFLLWDVKKSWNAFHYWGHFLQSGSNTSKIFIEFFSNS